MSRNQKSDGRDKGPCLPKEWRLAADLSLHAVAIKAGITGENPSRTYDRYESGENTCPPAVAEAVRKMSGGVVTAESWLKVRGAYLRERESRGGRTAHA